MDVNLRGILIGATLGDGYIDARKESRATLRVEHGYDQWEYADFKLQRLQSLLGGRGSLRFRERFDKRTGKVYKSCMFVVGNPVFLTIYRYIYRDKKKYLTRDLLNMLVPEGIAYWYMDDGYAKQVIAESGRVSSVYSMLYTYCSEDEASVVVDYFSEVWNIHPTKVRMYATKWAIKFNTAESKKLIALITDFIPPCMAYKEHHVISQLSQEYLQQRVVCKICGELTRNLNTSVCQSCNQPAAKR